jgi:hypothetical protein
MPQAWIWQRAAWPRFGWNPGALASALARARLAQGKILGATRLLDPELTLEAVAAILVEEGVTTSAIEGERLDLDAVRSSVARHLGLPTAGLSAPPRAVDEPGRGASRCHPASRAALDHRAPVRVAGRPVPDRLLGTPSDPDWRAAR